MRRAGFACHRPGRRREAHPPVRAQSKPPRCSQSPRGSPAISRVRYRCAVAGAEPKPAMRNRAADNAPRTAGPCAAVSTICMESSSKSLARGIRSNDCLRLLESVDVEAQAQQAWRSRPGHLEERKRGVRHIEVEAFVAVSEQHGSRAVEAIGRA